jgi:hypothetical protein
MLAANILAIPLFFVNEAWSYCNKIRSIAIFKIIEYIYIAKTTKIYV